MKEDAKVHCCTHWVHYAPHIFSFSPSRSRSEIHKDFLCFAHLYFAHDHHGIGRVRSQHRDYHARACIPILGSVSRLNKFKVAFITITNPCVFPRVISESLDGHHSIPLLTLMLSVGEGHFDFTFVSSSSPCIKAANRDIRCNCSPFAIATLKCPNGNLLSLSLVIVASLV